MSAKFVSRLIVVITLGFGLGLFRHQVAQRYYDQGREAFIAERGQNWDRFYAHPHHIITGLVVNIILATLLFGIYELLVCGVARLFRGPAENEKRN